MKYVIINYIFCKQINKYEIRSYVNVTHDNLCYIFSERKKRQEVTENEMHV